MLDIIVAIAFWIAPLVIAAWAAVHLAERNSGHSRVVILTAAIVLVLCLAIVAIINLSPVQSEGLFGKATLLGLWPLAAICIPLSAGAIVGTFIGMRQPR